MNLVRNSGVKDKNFLRFIKEVPSQCEVCMRFKKAKPKPVVGMPLASTFNELVAMDIKEIKGCKVLHMIDHATRYSVACPLKTKEAKEIVNVVMKRWVAYFGCPRAFLTDNGREFDNSEFRDMAQNLNAMVRTTAAYSPWSNGLNERHNAILGEMVLKTMEDTQCSLEVAVPWAVSAKNALANIHGFSANQLVFGCNPNTPSVLTNAPPALEGVTTSESVAISRGGKATGANKFVMNVSVDGKHPTWVDFKRSVAEWRLKSNSDEGSSLDSEDSFESVDDVLAVQENIEYDWMVAKANELDSWKSNSVYNEVENTGQDRIQCRWICTTKDTTNGKVAKARLVAKGFQDTEANTTRSDSPTCAKESLRLVLMLIAAHNWELNSMDIKTAFLQGKKFDREVFVVPPAEAKVEKGMIWKLNKCLWTDRCFAGVVLDC